MSLDISQVQESLKKLHFKYFKLYLKYFKLYFKYNIF